MTVYIMCQLDFLYPRGGVSPRSSILNAMPMFDISKFIAYCQKGILVTIVNLIYVLNWSRNLNAILMCCFPDAGFNCCNDSVSLSKDKGYPPSKIRFILNSLICHILSHLNRIWLFGILKRCPGDCAIFPLHAEILSNSSLPHGSSGMLGNNPSVFLLHCLLILRMIQYSLQYLITIAINIHLS